jgi:RHS repeat-associated protein
MFTGREFDPETGLYHYRARAYDPRIGRFLQRDPIGFYDNINPYTYVGNNPLKWIDPLGMTKADVITKGSYVFIKYAGDTHHGGKHWHVLARKGGNLLGRVSLEGKVLTGSIPRKALKLLTQAGGIQSAGGAAITGAGKFIRSAGKSILGILGLGLTLDSLASEVAAGTISEWAIEEYSLGKITYAELIDILVEQGIVESDPGTDGK